MGEKSDVLYDRMLRAIESGNYGEVQQILVSGSYDVDCTDSNMKSVLHHAVAEEHGAIVNLLLSNGANVNVRDVPGRTPIAYATTPDVKGILISHGAEVREEGDKHYFGIKLLIFTRRGDIKGVLECVRVAGEACVQYSDYDDRTALHIACTVGSDAHYKIAEILLSNGAKVNVQDIFGYKPIDNA